LAIIFLNRPEDSRDFEQVPDLQINASGVSQS